MLRTISSLLIIIGAGLIGFAFFGYDPTIPQANPFADSGNGLSPDRTLNLGLLTYQIMLTITGAALFVGGCALEVAARLPEIKRPS